MDTDRRDISQMLEAARKAIAIIEELTARLRSVAAARAKVGVPV